MQKLFDFYRVWSHWMLRGASYSAPRLRSGRKANQKLAALTDAVAPCFERSVVHLDEVLHQHQADPQDLRAVKRFVRLGEQTSEMRDVDAALEAVRQVEDASGCEFVMAKPSEAKF